MKILALGTLMLLSTQVWSHGEDKPGPNGGFIMMPGAFHVELVPVDAKTIKAYLLDIEFKSPTVKDSSVDLRVKSTKAKCTTKADHFVCTFPEAVNLSKAGQLQASATREKQKGNMVKYTLPLKLKKEESQESHDHR